MKMKLFATQVTTFSICCSFIFCDHTGRNMDNTGSIRPPAPGKEMAATGMIAYIRDETEIRLISPEGQNDHRIWTYPGIQKPLGLFGLAWRPDGRELAFSSGHEAIYSLYDADLYTIRPDGSGLRKITNAPDHKNYDNYKKGSVSIRVSNYQYTFKQAQSSSGVFILNIVGSDEPQQIVLPPGTSKTVVFKNVADFGTGKPQAIVAMFGRYRWFMPGADVVAGRHTVAPEFTISGDGVEFFGAYRPVWKSDGSLLGYRDGLCLANTIPPDVKVGEEKYTPLFGDETPDGACTWDWGPIPSLANKILYSQNESDEGSGFYLMNEGGKHDPSTRLVIFSDIPYQIANDVKWLPDASGFLYSCMGRNPDDASMESNIYRYDFKTKKTTQITKLKKGQYARRFTISPDGDRIVYEKCRPAVGEDENTIYDLQILEDVDLWMIRVDGSNEKLFVKNGLAPSWSR